MLLLYRLLRGKKYREERRRRTAERAGPPGPMRWRPKLKIYGLITGLIGGLGAVILVAQYGIAPVTNRALSTRGIGGALFSGILVPSLIFVLVVWRYNKKLSKLGHHPKHPLPSPSAMAASFFVVGALGAALYVAVPPAAAEVNGPCTAFFAGVDAQGRTLSAGDAIEVPAESSVNYTVSAPSDLQRWNIILKYGPFTQVIARGSDQPDDPNDLGLGLDEDGNILNARGSYTVVGNTIDGVVETEDYAWLGAGLYEVRGVVATVDGESCSGSVLIDVQGDPLSTVAGAASAAATAIGVLGAVSVAIGAGRDGGERLDELSDLSPAGIDIDGDGIVDILAEDIRADGTAIVDLDGDGVADTVDLTGPALVDEDGNLVPVNDRGEAFTWDSDGWRWMPRGEAEALIAAQVAADRSRAHEQAEFARDTQRVLDQWMADRVRSNQIEAIVEDFETARRRAEWDRFGRLQDAALANDMFDVLERLADDETVFDDDGVLDVDRMDRLQTLIRNRQRLEQIAPDPTYGEGGDVLMALDEVSRGIPTRIAAGVMTGGVSEIFFQGRAVMEAVADAAGDSTEWRVDPRTGQRIPPGDFGFVDGLRSAADVIAMENIPGYNTVQTMRNPRATWGDVAGAALWDVIGARLARGELAEAAGQLRGAGSTLSGGRIRFETPEFSPMAGGARGAGSGSAGAVPVIRIEAGDVVAPQRVSSMLPPSATLSDLHTVRVGDAIPPSMIPETGLTGHQINQLQDFANTHQVGVDFRAINPDSMRHLRDGTAVGKPLDIKSKTLKLEDYYLGACELDDIGKAGLYDPSKFTPRDIPANASAELRASIEKMAADRARELDKYGDDIQDYLRKNGGNADGAVLRNADGKAFAGDIDGVRFLDANGNTITDPQRYQELKDAWTQADANKTGRLAGVGEHGMESHVVSDIVDGHYDSLPRGQAVDAHQLIAGQNRAGSGAETLRSTLVNNRLTGKDQVLGVRPNGNGIVKGAQLDAAELADFAPNPPGR